MNKHKIFIDRVFDRYFSSSTCRFVVVVRYKDDGEWIFGRLFFNTREEMMQVQEGETIMY